MQHQGARGCHQQSGSFISTCLLDFKHHTFFPEAAVLCDVALLAADNPHVTSCTI